MSDKKKNEIAEFLNGAFRGATLLPAGIATIHAMHAVAHNDMAKAAIIGGVTAAVVTTTETAGYFVRRHFKIAHASTSHGFVAGLLVGMTSLGALGAVNAMAKSQQPEIVKPIILTTSGKASFDHP